MKINVPSPDELRHIAHGKSKPTIVKVSSSLPPDADHTARLIATHSTTATDYTRAAAFLNPDNPTSFFMAVRTPDGGCVARLITGATPDPEDNTQVLCSNSNTLGNAVPIRISTTALFGRFSSLLSRAKAEASSLNILGVTPEDADGPPDGDGNPSAITLDAIHWPQGAGDGEGDRPVFAAHNLLFPVPRGQDFPDSFDIMSFEFGDAIEFTEIKNWQYMLRYIIQHNDGHSVTMGGNLFHIPFFVGANSFPFPIRDEVGLGAAEYLTLDPVLHQRQFQFVEEVVTAMANGVFFLNGLDLPPPPPAAAGGGGGPAALLAPGALGTDTNPVKLAWAPGAQQETLSKPEKEQKAHSDNVGIKWRLAFARESTTQPGTIELPTLSPPFEEVLSKSNKTVALRLAKENLELCIAAAGTSDERMHGSVTLTQDLMSSGLLTAIRNFDVTTDAPNVDINKFKIGVSICNFCTADVDSVTLATTQSECLILLSGEYAATPPKKQDRGTLYLGSIKSRACILNMIANFITFFEHFVPGAKESLVCQALLVYFRSLSTPKAAMFIDRHAPKHPALLYNIVQDLSATVSAAFSVANSPVLVQAVKAGQPIRSLSYQVVTTVSIDAQRRISNAVISGRLGEYIHSPMDLMLAMDAPSLRDKGESGKRPASPGKNAKENPSKKTKSESGKGKGKGKGKDKEKSNNTSGGGGSPTAANPAKEAAELAEGFLIHTQDPRPPLLPHVSGVRHKPSPDTRHDQICQYVATQGWRCTSTKCKRPHVADATVLAEADFAKLKAFVAKTDNLFQWAPGKEPAAGE